jgi:hypothetical protein
VAQAITARSQPHRAFGGDVDAVGLEGLQRRDARIRLVGQADLGIGGAGEGAEITRRQQNFVAQCAQATHGSTQRVDYAVDLRLAGVADDGCNAHPLGKNGIKLLRSGSGLDRRCQVAGGVPRFLAGAFELHDFLPGHQAQLAARIFHQRRGFRPSRRRCSRHATDVADLGLVDVTADDAIQAFFCGLLGQASSKEVM